MTETTEQDNSGNRNLANADMVAQGMLLVSRKYLRLAAGILALYYLLRGTQYLIIFGAGTGIPLAMVAFATVLYSGSLWWAEKKGRLADRFVEPALSSVSVLLAVNAFWNLYLTRDPGQFYGILNAVIVFGFTSTSARAWIFYVSLCVGVTALAQAQYELPVSMNLPSMILSALMISLAIFAVRFSTLRQHVELEAELIRKTGKLEAANLAKDRFLATMTHELRTPMTGVLGMIDLLRGTRLTRQQAEMIAVAKTSAHYLLAIINDILDYSKLEAGKVILRPDVVDAVRLSRETVGLLGSVATGKAIDLRVDIRADIRDGQSLWVRLDPVRVGQILLNLTNNAIKFTEKGSVTVTLSQLETDAGPCLEWQVSDTGAGIPKARLGALFQRFEQLDNSASRQQQGTGLGLAIIRELALLMGGEVTVQSEIGVGSTFCFRMPLVSAPAPLPEMAQPVAQLPVAAPSENIRILVAEDNPVNQMLITRILTKNGWQVQMVANGEAAVAAATKSDHAFDVVLMDVQMPVMDGVTATRIIRDKMACPPPVIALTANTLKADLVTYRAAGFCAHVGKPIDIDDLYRAIRAAVAARKDPVADA